MSEVAVRSVFLSLLLGLFASNVYAAADTRGYIARKCGMDMDGDGVIGETADDCNVCDGAATNNGQNQIYVDAGAGNDTTGLGTSAAPWKTVGKAYTVATTANIVCVKGTFAAGTAVSAAGYKGGTATTYTVAARGNELRSFQYPQLPFLTMGWDADNDGCYPPFDDGSAGAISAGCSATADVAVFDGGGTLGNLFQNLNDVGYVEFAHFTAKRYVSTGSGQFHQMSPANGVSHLYFHDIEAQEMNKDVSGGITMFQFLGSSDIDHFAAENMKCTDCGGTFFWARGFFGGNPAVLSSFFRFKNLEYHVANNVGTAGLSWSDLGGAITSVEVIDNLTDCDLDRNLRQCTSGAHFGHCSTDHWIVNNEGIDGTTFISMEVDEGAADIYCGTLGRPMDDVVIARNICSLPNADLYGKRTLCIEIQAGATGSPDATSQYETVRNLTIDNNLCIGGGEGWTSCLWLDGSHGGPPGSEVGGVWKVRNNTLISKVDPSGSSPCEAVVCVLNEQVSGPPTIEFQNNLIQTAEVTEPVIDVKSTADVATWTADNNAYSTGVKWKWKTGAATTDIAAWRTQSGGDTNAKQGAAKWNETGSTTLPTSDGRLHSTDLFASASGMTIAAVTIDAFETARTAPYSIGYHELTSVTCATNADCNDANPCTDDSCSATVCTNTNDGANTCDDGAFCNGAEDCNGSGVCLHAGNPCAGADGDTDCSETCDETANACTANDPTGSACNDAITCTASDTCTGAGVCVGISTCLPTENCEPTSGLCESTTVITVPPGEPVRGPGYIPDGATECGKVRVNQLDAPAGRGRICSVTDGANPADCTVGGGSYPVKCVDRTPALGGWWPMNFGDFGFDSLGRPQFKDAWLYAGSRSFIPSDATPSVALTNVFETANVAATTITTFDDMPTGQPVTVRFRDNVTTIQFSNANFVGHGELDWLAATGDMLTCIKFTDAIVCATTAGGSAVTTGTTAFSSNCWITAANQNPTCTNSPTGPYTVTAIDSHTSAQWTGSGTCSAPKFDVGTTATQDLFINDQGALQTDESKTHFDGADGTVQTAFGAYQATLSPFRARVQSCTGPLTGHTLVVITYHLVDDEPTGSVANLAATSYLAAGSCEMAYTYEGETANAAAVNTGLLGSLCNGIDSQSADVDDVGRETVAPLRGNTSADFKEMGSSNNDYFQITDATCIASLSSESLSDKTWMSLVKPAQIGVTQTLAGDYSGSNFTGYQVTIGNKFGVRVGHGVAGSPTSTLRESTTLAAVGTLAHVATVYKHTSPTLAVYVNCALQAGSGATSANQQMVKAAAPPTSFAAVSVSGSSEVGAKLDDTVICNDELTALEVAYAASCGLDGLACACDGTTPANYATCATNADCTVGANTAVCNTTALTCSGYRQTICAGATLPACNHSPP